jgi:hypothetical protein
MEEEIAGLSDSPVRVNRLRNDGGVAGVRRGDANRGKDDL